MQRDIRRPKEPEIRIRTALTDSNDGSNEGIYGQAFGPMVK